MTFSPIININSNNLSLEAEMEDTLETIAAMLHQEATGYETSDWMQLQKQLEQNEPYTLCSTHRPLHQQPEPVDTDCRNKMAAWCTQVVDFCKFNRETVEIAMSHLDRFLSTKAGVTARQDRTVYQLASMAALYTAVKIHEPEAMDPKLVSNLSRGAYSPRDVEHMEATILMALQWRLNPPTSMAFVRQLLELIPQDAMDEEMRQTALDLAKFQTELAVNTYQFVTVKASTLAFCSLMNSLESIGLDGKVLGYLGFILSQALHIDSNDPTVATIQNALYQAVLQQPVDPAFGSPRARGSRKPSSRRMSFEVSPRSVSAMTR